MTWFDTSANELESLNTHVAMFIAVDFDFPSGHARYWSGIGNLTLGGNVYAGTGEIGSISVPTESIALVAERKTYRLSGVDPTLVPESDIDNSFGRSVVEYFGFLNPTTYALVAQPEINWEGQIDAFRRVDGSQPIIEVNAEHRMVLLDRPDNWRYTNEHQQQFFAGDVGFDQLAPIASREVAWGGQRAVVRFTGPRYKHPFYDL